MAQATPPIRGGGCEGVAAAVLGERADVWQAPVITPPILDPIRSWLLDFELAIRELAAARATGLCRALAIALRFVERSSKATTPIGARGCALPAASDCLLDVNS
jgi:hypothetical protein